MELTSFAILAAITFAGAVMAAAFGIGFAILAAPLFLVVMDSTGAIPVLAVLNLAASVLVAARIWRQAPGRLLGLLCAGSVCGFPIGLVLFGRADVSDLKLVTGVVIMLFVLLLLAREREYIAFDHRRARAEHASAPIALVVGALAGAMGTALAMPGPVAMLYFVVLRLTKDQSRALSLTFFSFVYIVVCLLHAWDGGLDAPRLWFSAKLIPAVFAGAVAGHWLARHVSEARFRELVLVILFVAGLYAVGSI
jgi:uncharacterized membrane protein YfcA